MNRIALSSLLIAAGTSLASFPFAAWAGPEFTTIKRSLETAPVAGAKVLYWDQMLADDLGVVTARGRVGEAAFDRSVTEQIAVLIKQNPLIVEDSVSATHPTAKTRFVEIELDAHGGSGRAGYIKLRGRDGQDLWVNIKGIGLTGLGNAKSKPAGPPLETYGDHSDGSADLPEGIVETINAAVAFNESKYSAGRILSLVSVNMNLNVEGGRKLPLILIVRAPQRRMDRELAGPSDYGKTLSRITDSLAQANSKRIFKGDFVNQSNIGAGGEFVDFGLFALVNGYVPAFNYLKVTTFKETEWLFGERDDVRRAYRASIGYYLVNQMGIEEDRVSAIQGRAKFAELTERFLKLIYKENAPIDAENSGREKAAELAGNFRLHVLFRTMASDIVAWKGTRAQLLHHLTRQARALNKKPSLTFNWDFQAFANTAIDLVQAATKDVAGSAEYAAKVAQIAKFKNRDVEFLDKRNLREWAFDRMNDYVRTGDARVVQKAIDEVVSRSKLGTSDFSTSQVRVTADSRATYLDMKASVDDSGHHGLFSYPEVSALDRTRARKFEVSVDGRASYVTKTAQLIETERGLYYRITLPHGELPVTDKVTSIVPVDAASVEITTAPLLLNERMGLSRDFARVPSLMRTRYGVRIDPVPSDSVAKRILIEARPVRTCSNLFGG